MVPSSLPYASSRFESTRHDVEQDNREDGVVLVAVPIVDKTPVLIGKFIEGILMVYLHPLYKSEEIKVHPPGIAAVSVLSVGNTLLPGGS
jgi:hypothetical protein